MYKIDDIIKLKNSNIHGKIININKNKLGNIYTILLDTNLKINVSENKIEPCNINNITTHKNINKVKISYKLKNNNFDNELMIRHQNVLEAMENVDRFISSAITNKEKRLRIIHGRHGGILRNAVHEYLKNSPYVESYKLADEYEGSIGVTIVYLK